MAVNIICLKVCLYYLIYNNGSVEQLECKIPKKIFTGSLQHVIASRGFWAFGPVPHPTRTRSKDAEAAAEGVQDLESSLVSSWPLCGKQSSPEFLTSPVRLLVDQQRSRVRKEAMGWGWREVWNSDTRGNVQGYGSRSGQHTSS